MALIGEEKRIRASFHELRLADECELPQFSSVWHRAQSPSTSRRLAPAFRVAAALFVAGLAIAAFTLVARYWQRSAPLSGVVANELNKAPTVPAQIKPASVGPAAADRRVADGGKVRPSRFSARNRPEVSPSTVRSAMAISQWQSPTATLLRSPADDLLRSLPRLNETAAEMKTFLPSPAN
jgi:hypothetical protein